jgi:VWFA-related protein
MFYPGLRWRMAPVGLMLVFAGHVVSAEQNQSQPKVNLEPRATRAALAPVRTNPSLRLDVTMILVPVTVTDSLDRPVDGLPANQFRIFEDGIEQRIKSVVREEGPVSVGFIFDASSSMKGRMEKSIEAVKTFLNTMTPGDEFFLIRFNDEPQQLTGFTPNPDDILGALSFVKPEGWTALNDAICLGMQRMHSAKNARRALFVLTDGGDNNSRYSEPEVRALAKESNVRVYSIGLITKPRFLEKVAADTGGRAYSAPRLDDLPKAVERLSTEFRNTYVVGYSPKNEQHDGKYRRVRVEILDTLTRLPLHAFWRLGYYAPRE